MSITLLKPCQMKRKPAWHKVYADGREILNLRTKRGLEEYRHRTDLMWERQGNQCVLKLSQFCKENNGRWDVSEINFDHENLRGVGRQDDRIEVDGKPLNHAICHWCNTQRGSQKWDAVAPKDQIAS